MVFRLLILILLTIGCETKQKKTDFSETDRKLDNKFFTVNINNDKTEDTAFIFSEPNQTKIKFSNNIGEINLNQNQGIFISETVDLNNDSLNEIVIFSRTNEGWWNNVSVFSYSNNSWKEIAKTDAFIPEDKNFENRIVKENGVYYLVGEDKWNEDINGEFVKTKIKI